MKDLNALLEKIATIKKENEALKAEIAGLRKRDQPPVEKQNKKEKNRSKEENTPSLF